MKYTLISGYNPIAAKKCGDGFFRTWLTRVSRMTPMAEQIILICDSGAFPPWCEAIREDYDELFCQASLRMETIALQGDLGNHLQVLSGERPYAWSGWTGAVLSGAMLAYTNCTDMVFVEQDCLCFGDVVGQMEKEIGDGGIIYGSYDKMPCAQSLFMVRHNYLPEFVRLFLGEGPQSDPANLGEHIFGRLEQRYPDKWKRFSFGCDRQRPIPFDEPVFYVQQLTSDELAELKNRHLI